MESKKLEALLMAADLGSFTKAAEVLGYTQSGLTHMMNSLEREVGFPLLDRGRHGVRLTEEGEALVPLMRAFLRAGTALNDAVERLSASRSETIRVAAYASLAMHWLPAIIQTFRAENPNVDVDIRMADHVDAPYTLLLQGKMDVIFVSRQEPGPYDWVHLKDDAMYAVLPKDYPVKGDGTFSLHEFDGSEFLMPAQGFDKDILRIFDREGVHANVRPTVVDDATVVSMVEHGLGISMMTELTLKGRAEHVLTLPVSPAASRELGLAVRSLSEAPEMLRRFIACTKQVVRELSVS
ncbi:MAG: LysR family transcriptional regulator [Oscillospiraceae bacterium]|nr:LysR family transcriptional regulator [Oscillospiraceae bacterium]